MTLRTSAQKHTLRLLRLKEQFLFRHLSLAELEKRSQTISQTRIPEWAKIEGAYLESKLTFRLFATLTTHRQTSQRKLAGCFTDWKRGVQEYNRVTIGYIKAEEYEPRRHIHVALIAAAPLDPAQAAQLWRTIADPRYSQAADVRPYSNGMDGLAYILKSHGTRFGDVELSHNIAAFARDAAQPLSSLTPAQRRQRRHIATQEKEHRGCAVPPVFKNCPAKIPAESLPSWPEDGSLPARDRAQSPSDAKHVGAPTRVIPGKKGAPKTVENRLTVKELVAAGCFVDTIFPLRVIASLTTSGQLSRAEFDDLTKKLTRGIEARTRSPLGLVKAYECEPQGRTHIARIALVASAPLDWSRVGYLWRSIARSVHSGMAEVTPYRGAPCGLDYVTKQLNASFKDIEFSANLAAFAIEDTGPRSRFTSAQQRRSRR
jgi:hypothetical protein